MGIGYDGPKGDKGSKGERGPPGGPLSSPPPWYQGTSDSPEQGAKGDKVSDNSLAVSLCPLL